MEEANHNEATQRSSSTESSFGVSSAQHMFHHSGYRHGSPTAATISVDADGRSEPQRGNTTQLVAESSFGVSSAQHMCHHSGYRHGSPTAATISVDAVCGRAQGAHLAPNIYAAGG
ncbi:hypothetical protein MRX96_000074 [Rhipicephalus microplus]